MPSTSAHRTSMRTALRMTCLALALVALALWGSSVALRTEADLPEIRFANAKPSRDALIAGFVQALSANDREAIEKLRIDQNEYRNFILPGSVKPGRPPQIMPDDKNAYFWQHHNTLSVYSLGGLLKSYGGKIWSVRKIEYPRVDEFAWYIAHRDPIIHLQSEDGTVTTLQVGTIAEHNGRFKFISYRSD
jgi:hypothetical protein